VDSPDSASDAAVIAASVDDPDRFGVIFDRYHDTVFRYIARRVGSQSASDVTADVFVRAFRVRARFDTSRNSARPWLYGIATNIIGDHIRGLRRRERLFLACQGLVDRHIDDPTDDTTVRVSAGQAANEINRALGRLSPGDRNALLLFAVEQLSYPEVAEALGIPVGTVRSRIFRARRVMRELIGHLEQTTNSNRPPPGDHD
jgi:RNA polymerase sigma-70 factor (ECF subfamily)